MEWFHTMFVFTNLTYIFCSNINIITRVRKYKFLTVVISNILGYFLRYFLPIVCMSVMMNICYYGMVTKFNPTVNAWWDIRNMMSKIFVMLTWKEDP